MNFKIFSNLNSKNHINKDAKSLEGYILKYRTGYECISGPCVPYYDYDFNYSEANAQKDKVVDDYELGYNEVKALFPKATIYSFCSNGEAKGKFKNSYHFIVRGAGCYSQGSDVPQTPGCDKSVYKNKGKVQKFRLPFLSKEEQKRPKMRCALIENGLEIIKYKIDSLPNSEKLSDYMITNIVKEKLIINYAETKEHKSLNSKSITFNELKDLCYALNIARLNDRTTWILFIHCIRNIYFSCAELKESTEKQDIIDLVVAVSEQDSKFDSHTLTKINQEFENETINENHCGIGSLKWWAKTDNAGEYMKIKNKYSKRKTIVIEKKSALTDKEFNNLIIDAQSCVRVYNFNDKSEKFAKAGVNDIKLSYYDIIKFLCDSVYRLDDKVYTLYENEDGVRQEQKKDIVKGIFYGINDFDMTVGDETVSMNDMFKTYYRLTYYDRISFEPKMVFTPSPNNKTINLFTGFKHNYTLNTEFKSNLTEMYFSLLHELCQGDEELIELFDCFNAHMFQKPNEKPNIAILMYSKKQGVGKNIFINMVKNAMGVKHSHTFTSINQLLAKHNTPLACKILIVLDEISNYTKMSTAEELKSMITNEVLTINPKGKDQYTIKDCSHIIMTTNCDNPIRITAEDRRYVMIDCDNTHIGDSDYFKRVAEEMNSTKCQNALAHHFYTKDISKFNPRLAPQTTLKQSITMDQTNKTTRFIISLCKDEDEEYENVMKFKTQELYQLYKEWCNDSGETSQSKKIMVSELNHLNITKKTIKIDKKGCSGFRIKKSDMLAHFKSLFKSNNFEF